MNRCGKRHENRNFDWHRLQTDWQVKLRLGNPGQELAEDLSRRDAGGRAHGGQEDEDVDAKVLEQVEVPRGHLEVRGPLRPGHVLQQPHRVLHRPVALHRQQVCQLVDGCLVPLTWKK